MGTNYYVRWWKTNDSMNPQYRDWETKEQDLFNKLQKEAISQSAKEIQDLDILYRTSQNHALSLEERKRAVDKLQSIYPNYFKNIEDEIILNGGAVKSYQNLRLAILDAARAKAAQSELDRRAQERLQKELDLQERLNKQLEIYRNPKPIQSVSVGSTGGSRTFVSAETVKNDAKAAAFAIIQEQKKLREDAQKEDALLLGIIEKGANKLGKASEDKGKEIVHGLRRGMTNSSDVTANRTAVKEKVEEAEKEPINPATGNTYKSELESMKAAQAAQIQAKLDQLNLEDQINSQAYEREKEWSDKKKELARLEAEAKVEMLYLYSDALSLIADAVGENTAVGKVYRKEDIDAAGDKVVNPGLGAKGSDKYSIWLFKGGLRCLHVWQRVIYLRKGDNKISVNQARKMILELEPELRDKAGLLLVE